MTKAGFLKSGFGQQGQLWRIALGMVWPCRLCFSILPDCLSMASVCWPSPF